MDSTEIKPASKSPRIEEIQSPSPARLHFVRYWLPVLAWMTVIFIASTDLFSGQRTSRFIGPFLRWLIPDISPEGIGMVQLIVRKCGHLTEYAILASLVWRARLKAFLPRLPLNTWPVQQAKWVIAFCCAYAISDEFHQYFVASREASVRDVVIDTCGAVLAMGILRFVGRRLKRW